jgi:hypothetical protein
VGAATPFLSLRHICIVQRVFLPHPVQVFFWRLVKLPIKLATHQGIQGSVDPDQCGVEKNLVTLYQTCFLAELDHVAEELFSKPLP